LLQVKRTDDRAQRRIFIKSTDYSTSQKFKDALKRGLGVGVICNLTNFEVEALIASGCTSIASPARAKRFA
jgi:hypothetical protein